MAPFDIDHTAGPLVALSVAVLGVAYNKPLANHIAESQLEIMGWLLPATLNWKRIFIINARAVLYFMSLVATIGFLVILISTLKNR